MASSSATVALMAPERFDGLLAAAREGDEAAWAEIWGELSPAVLGYLRGSSLSDPEDTLSEAFLQAARDLHKFEGDWPQFRGWVFTIAHHRLIDARRHAARRPVDLVAEPPEPEGVPLGDAETEALERIGAEQVRRVLDSLSPDQRDVLLLRIVGDLSLDQCAEALGKRTGAVKQLQRRGLGRDQAAAPAGGGNPVSGNDAFRDEMAMRLTPEDDRELNLFALATRATLMASPDAALGRNVVPELAAAAAAGTRAAARSAPASNVRIKPIPRRRPRFAMAARIAFAAMLVPALFAGLAVAGVKLPDPAQDVFKAAGISLPNQEDSSDASGTGGDSDESTTGDDPAQGKGKGLDKSNPARERGRGNGEQGRGRALGKRGIPPGHDKAKGNNGGQGNGNSGSNAGGNGKAVGKDGTPPGQTKAKPVAPPKPVVPPGQAKKGDTPAPSSTGGGNSGGNGGGNGAVKKTLGLVNQVVPD